MKVDGLMGPKEQIEENLRNDGNYYSCLGLTGHVNTGFCINTQIEGEEPEPGERVIVMYTGLGGAVMYIEQFYKDF